MQCIIVSAMASVSSENIPSINLVLHVIQAGVVAVGDDGGGKCLEL